MFERRFLFDGVLICRYFRVVGSFGSIGCLFGSSGSMVGVYSVCCRRRDVGGKKDVFVWFFFRYIVIKY